MLMLAILLNNGSGSRLWLLYPSSSLQGCYVGAVATVGKESFANIWQDRNSQDFIVQ